HPVTDDSHTTAVGPYVTANDERGIRNYNMAFPTAGGEWPLPGKYPFVNPLNFSDIGYDLTGPQVHADGEIWSATNFDIRELLNNRYPYIGQEIQRECADGLRPVYDCPGNRRWVQIVFDSFLLMPVRPSFLDARNAQLAADVLRFGGANQDLLWLAFARRGFGQNAFNRNEEDRQPIPDFESPLHDEATVVFNALAKDEGRQPVNARIYVGHYEARVSPIADTDPATGGQQNWDNVARFVPDDFARANSGHRAYEFIAHAAGYGHVRFRLSELKPGETRVVTILFPTNWASTHKGAVASGDGENHDRLIDDTEGTNWQSTGAPVQGRQVVVQLPGAQRFEVVKVSAALVPETNPDETVRSTQNRFTALREFEIYACTANADRQNPTCDPTKRGPDGSNGPTQNQAPLGFKPVVNSQSDAFPGFTPRPVAPELNLRTWQAPTTTATHVLFRVLDNQCTGQPYFHGEQDLSVPNTSTDCRIGTLPTLPPRNKEVRAAELQLLSSRPVVIGAQAVD
ncbi:MAG: M36 family metallopeptidase, partial [Actinomycetota bacterium]|nr:M36 family metallopeptidase [Actinomycetota bacterium]